MIRAKIFEKAAKEVIDNSWWTCNALDIVGCTEEEDFFWKCCHEIEGKTRWFGPATDENQRFRETLLLEMAFNLRNYGY